MSESQLALYKPPTNSLVFLSERARLYRNHTIAAVVITLLLGGLYLLGNGNLALALGPLSFAGILIAVCWYPTLLIPLTIVCSCIFELTWLGRPDSITDRVPLFWDFNTICQVYGRLNIHILPLTLYEMLVIPGLLSALIRGIYNRTLSSKGGVLIGPIIAYIVCVSGGAVNGIARGGDSHIAIFEIRAQLYILLAYLLMMNSGRQARPLAHQAIVLTVVGVGLKGVLLTIRYFFTLGGHVSADSGVGAHEESFFFDLFAMLFLVLKLADVEPTIRRSMLFLMPFVLIANLTNERRAAIAALAIAIPVLFFLSYMAFPQRRPIIAKIVCACVAIGAIYFPLFWNSQSIIAQPAHAIKSQFDADPRDQSSDDYRLAEDANLMFTMRTEPIFGYGYGRPMYVTTPMVNLSAIDPLILYLTHDQILWVWMRLGTIGFFVFWTMIASFLIRSSQLAVNHEQDSSTRVIGVFGAVTISTLLVFALLDLQLSCVRDVLYASAWMGIVALALREVAERELAERDARLRRMSARLGYRPAHGHVNAEVFYASAAARVSKERNSLLQLP